MDTDLAATIVGLEGGVANLDPTAALAEVEGWRTRLGGAGFAHAREIGDALSDLANRLARGELEGVGDVLASLGNLVGGTIAVAPAEVAEDLARLSELLTEAANAVV